MSVRKQPLGAIPDDTVRIARAAFRKGNVYITIADKLGTIYDFTDFVEAFSSTGQPAVHPVRLALVTILQFAEGLSDRAAAESVRSRIDWKYLLHLDLEDEGFDFSVLSEFRDRLINKELAQHMFDKLVESLREAGLVKARGKQRSDSMHVLAAIRVLNRLELVHETMRMALESVALIAEDWLVSVAPIDWYKRYAGQMFAFRAPKSEKDRDKLACQIGEDGFRLLTSIDAESNRTFLTEIPAVKILRTVWGQQFTEPPGPPQFRKIEDQPAGAERIASPHDEDARFSSKRGTEWTGFKVHITETCDDGSPRLITNVETTLATQPDSGLLPTIHNSLNKLNLLPDQHLVDTGYVNTESIISSSQDFQVDVIGPPLEDSSWQAQCGGFDKSYFELDWDKREAKCPAGKKSRTWTVDKTGCSEVSFRPSDCYRCRYREVCVRGTTNNGHPKARHLSLKPRLEHETLTNARARIKTEEFKKLYSARSGVEGTLSQGVRTCNMRKSRYIGLKKTALANLLIGIALNLTKAGKWLMATPLAKTRESRMARLRVVSAA